MCARSICSKYSHTCTKSFRQLQTRVSHQLWWFFMLAKETERALFSMRCLKIEMYLFFISVPEGYWSLVMNKAFFPHPSSSLLTWKEQCTSSLSVLFNGSITFLEAKRKIVGLCGWVRMNGSEVICARGKDRWRRASLFRWMCIEAGRIAGGLFFVFFFCTSIKQKTREKTRWYRRYTHTTRGHTQHMIQWWCS